jgi:hypothetical protein
LVADALLEILDKAKEKEVVHGLLPELVEGWLTHLQYADDTILFLQYSDLDIANLKFLLFCYEELSGMKINYAKSEVYTVGLSVEEGQKVADAFNCKLGTFRMKYLG